MRTTITMLAISGVLLITTGCNDAELCGPTEYTGVFVDSGGSCPQEIVNAVVGETTHDWFDTCGDEESYTEVSVDGDCRIELDGDIYTDSDGPQSYVTLTVTGCGTDCEHWFEIIFHEVD